MNPVTFKPGTFDIEMQGEISGKRSRETVTGRVSSDGRFGLHKDESHGWRVTHLATGLLCGPDFGTISKARTYAKTLATRPDLMPGGEFGVLPAWAEQPSAELEDLIRSARVAVGG